MAETQDPADVNGVPLVPDAELVAAGERREFKSTFTLPEGYQITEVVVAKRAPSI